MHVDANEVVRARVPILLSSTGSFTSDAAQFQGEPRHLASLFARIPYLGKIAFS